MSFRAIKFTANKIQKWSIVFMIIFSIVVVAQNLAFLYNNLYLTMRSSETIFLMKGMFAMNKLNTTKLNSIKKKMEAKKAGCEYKYIRDPFSTLTSIPQNDTYPSAIETPTASTSLLETAILDDISQPEAAIQD